MIKFRQFFPVRQEIARDDQQIRPVFMVWIVPAFIMFSFLFTSLSITNKSATYDEPQHYRYGLQILLEHNSERFDDSKMPLSALNGLPRAAALSLQGMLDLEKPPSILYSMKTGRYMTVMFFMLLCLYVYRWSSSLYGWKGGLLSLFLTIFSPNLIAHSRLITTDIFATTSIVISMYYFWRMYRKPCVGGALKSGLALGVAQIAKYTSVFLFPIMLLIALVKWITSVLERTGGKSSIKRIHRLSHFGVIVLVHILAVVLVINIGFLGNRSGTPLKEYQFQSSFFKNIQSSAGKVAELPLPLPYPFLQGLDLVKFVDGHLINNTILFGNAKEPPKKFSNYYLSALLFKVPIAMQILFFWALIILARNWRSKQFLNNELFILFPAVFLGTYFNFFMTTQIGIRFALPLLPFIYILTGIILSGHYRRRLVPLFVLCGYLSISVISWFPHYISYFNELVPNRKMSYKILADSNVDFGQNEFYLQDFESKHPDAIFQPKYPVEGKLIVGANFVNPVFPNNDYHWLRDNFTPKGHIGYSHLVFDLSPQDIEKVNFSQVRYFNDPEYLSFATGNDYYGLNNWQGAGLEFVDELIEAELHYQKNVAFVPNEPEPHFSLARVYKKQGKYIKSLEHEEKALHLQLLDKIYQEGLLALKEKNYEEALIYFNDIIRQRSAYRLALFYKGLILQLQGLHGESVPFYKKSLNEVPGYFQAHFNLGYAFMKIGQLQRAIVHFEKTLKAKTDYEEARQHLAWCQKEILETGIKLVL